MRGDIELGTRLPDYELPDQDGVVRRLSDLQGSNPMVLHLSRGGFDPKEHRFLHHLVNAYLDFRVGYTRVVLISTDNQLEINEFRDSVGAQFPFLSDPERTVRSDLDIIEVHGRRVVKGGSGHTSADILARGRGRRADNHGCSLASRPRCAFQRPL